MENSIQCEDVAARRPQGLTRREKIIILAGLGFFAVASWALMIYQTGGAPDSMIPLTAPKVWILEAGLFVASWTLMAVAMMFPSVAPTVLTYSSVSCRQRASGISTVPTWIFVSGYVVAWMSLGIIAYIFNFSLGLSLSGHPLIHTYGVVVGGSILIFAGLYQFGPLKRLCLSYCRSPLNFLLKTWRNSARGVFWMGIQEGIYCIGCCWALMAVLFAVGAMNLAWMAILALVMFLEKGVPYGVEVSKVVGVLLVGAGLIVGFGPWLFGAGH
ncbi:MAG: DUF2182 domain-containing protein [Chloroflexi bacterium]|nr:DUF2182 domain-containing protein [Chloroflexota bacterium]